MRRTWGTAIIIMAAVLVADGCNNPYRPMLFHRSVPEPEACCPQGMEMSGTEGPMLGEPPMMPQGSVVNPGMIPQGTITIPGPGMTVPQPAPSPPVANPPVGPLPRTVPQGTPTILPGKPIT